MTYLLINNAQSFMSAFFHLPLCYDNFHMLLHIFFFLPRASILFMNVEKVSFI